MFFVITAFLLFVLGAHAQIAPSSFPDSYPGKPEGDFSTNWQKYYEIEEALPGVNFPVTRSFAGNIPVNRANHPNCSLFFWAVEKQNGSLTDEGSTEPWIIWLNGGPGSSSLYGLFFENGPIHITSNYSLVSNQFAWSNLADTIWIDQPVGGGTPSYPDFYHLTYIRDWLFNCGQPWLCSKWRSNVWRFPTIPIEPCQDFSFFNKTPSPSYWWKLCWGLYCKFSLKIARVWA